MLSELNQHSHDASITFEPVNHRYSIVGKASPVSVTTLIHSYFPEFHPDVVIERMMLSPDWPKSKYYNMAPKAIKKEWESARVDAAKKGTLMHKDIEDQINGIIVNNESREFSMFLAFWRDFFETYPMMKPYRTEWNIYDDIGIAGSIDCVLSDSQGNLGILDWKRSKEIKMGNKYQKGKGVFSDYEDCNYSHYTLQLNFYRHILERSYGKKVMFMMIVVFHPDNPSYRCYTISKVDLSDIWNENLLKVPH